PLVGHSDGGDLPTFGFRLMQRRLCHRQNRRPDGFRVMLHPATARGDLGKFLLNPGHRFTAPVEYHGAATRSPLVDGEDAGFTAHRLAPIIEHGMVDKASPLSSLRSDATLFHIGSGLDHCSFALWEILCSAASHP